MSSEDKKVCTRIITQSRKYFIKLEEDFDKNVKILVTDGKSVWESSKIRLTDLIAMKPGGIEESIHFAVTRYALFDEVSDSFADEGLKTEDILLEFSETSTGNLNISWKVKQSLGITIVFGTVILLKVMESDAPTRIIDLLEMALSASNLQKQLSESLDFNKKLLDEYERTVKDKLEREDELYTKFRVLLNKVSLEK